MLLIAYAAGSIMFILLFMVQLWFVLHVNNKQLMFNAMLTFTNSPLPACLPIALPRLRKMATVSLGLNSRGNQTEQLLR